MTRMVVDPGWVVPLRGAVGAIEMVSPDGETLGTFIGKHSMLAEIMADCPYSEEELNQMSAAVVTAGPESGRPLSSILHDLEEKWPSR